VIIFTRRVEMTRSRAQLERQVDVCTTDGTGIRGTGRAQDIAGANKSKGLKRQPILTSASVSLLVLKIVVSFPS